MIELTSGSINLSGCTMEFNWYGIKNGKMISKLAADLANLNDQLNSDRSNLNANPTNWRGG